MSFSRPDAIDYSACTMWPNALGCTKVLGLSREIGAEAIKVLECLVQTLDVHGRPRQALRSVFAHGTPRMSKSYSVHTSDYVPPVLTELAFLRPRKVEIAFRYPPKLSHGAEHYNEDGGHKLAFL